MQGCFLPWKAQSEAFAGHLPEEPHSSDDGQGLGPILTVQLRSPVCSPALEKPF